MEPEANPAMRAPHVARRSPAASPSSASPATHALRPTPHGLRPTPLALRPSALVFVGLVAASVAGLLAAPWALDAKLYAVVHGLCAQRPSHSYALGGTRLPFDARMTGIYGGFLVAAACLLARGGWRAARAPAPALVAALALFVVALGVDGVNSTLQDFGLPYLYQPDNRLRLATGLLTGTALAVLLLAMLNNVLWARVVDAPPLRGWRDFGALLAAQALLYLAIVSGWGLLYRPVALALVAGGVTVVLTLALLLLVLLYGRENRFERLPDLAGFATAALLLSYATLGLIAAARFSLEQLLGPNPLT